MSKISKALILIVVAVVFLVVAISASQASSAGSGLPDVDIKHICTKESGRDVFKITNNENKALSVRFKTAFNSKKVGLGAEASERVKGRVSQGSYPIAEVKKYGEVLDRARAQYKPCGR